MTSAALKRVEAAKAQLREAERALDDARARRRIKCACGRSHAIRDLDLIVTHYYIEPYGCTSGDYWRAGEWCFVCPKGVRNRLLFNDYEVDYDQRHTIGAAAEATFKHLYGGLFKSSTDEHDESGYDKGHNNFYVDEHRKWFELPPRPTDTGEK